MLKRVESLVLFVPNVVAAAHWYAEIFGAEVQFENPLFAFVRAPGVVVGFHPADEKCPGGVGGTSREPRHDMSIHTACHAHHAAQVRLFMGADDFRRYAA